MFATSLSSNTISAKAKSMYGKRLTEENYNDMLHKNNVAEIAAYLRILPEGMQFKDAAGIGRVIARKRGEGLGAEILRAGIDVARRQFHAKRIRLEAQSYAQGFYEKAGFVRCSEEFDEDGIPHVEMFLDL